MSFLLLWLDSWILAVILAILMLIGWAIGWWTGKVSPEHKESPGIKFNDASLALLGLLLGFTFSMSLAKHEQRRNMIVNDSNAIGDFYTCASLLDDPLRSQLQGVIRHYTEQRLELVEHGVNDAKTKEIQQGQDRMQELVKQAVDAHTPIAHPLVNTFNEVTTSNSSLLAALSDRLPASIVELLWASALVVMVLMGRHQKAFAHAHLVGTIGFILLISLTVHVILDLNQPWRGSIRLSHLPLQRLLSGMGK
jgi:hypothetical protein